MRVHKTIRTMIGALTFSLFVTANSGDRTAEAGESLDSNSSIHAFCGGWISDDSKVLEMFYKDITPAELLKCLEVGADPDTINNSGLTPLHLAAAYSANPTIITVLVEAGADPGTLDQSGHTPLHFAAAYSENPAVITALVEVGADPGALDLIAGHTPLHLRSCFSQQ